MIRDLIDRLEQEAAASDAELHKNKNSQLKLAQLEADIEDLTRNSRL